MNYRKTKLFAIKNSKPFTFGLQIRTFRLCQIKYFFKIMDSKLLGVTDTVKKLEALRIQRSRAAKKGQKLKKPENPSPKIDHKKNGYSPPNYHCEY